MTERVVDVASQTIALLRGGEFCDRFGVRLQPSVGAFQFREQGFGVLATCTFDTKGSRDRAHEYQRHSEQNGFCLMTDAPTFGRRDVAKWRSGASVADRSKV